MNLKENLNKFKKPLLCFTDGAAKKNSKNAPAGWAFYIPKLKYKKSGHMIGTNNQAELTAIKNLLLHLHSIKDNLYSNILIYSDSQYSIGVITGSTKYTINKELIEEIIELRSTLGKKVGFKYVEAHTKKTDYISECNNIVDKLASDAAENKSNENKLKMLELKLEELKIKLAEFETTLNELE